MSDNMPAQPAPTTAAPGSGPTATTATTGTAAQATTAARPASPVVVACLCAAWCRLCDGYGPVFRQVLAELLGDAQARGMTIQPHWVDIEDEAELLGDVDIETFPTLMVMAGPQLRFAGPLTPQPETLQRLLRATLLDAAPDQRWPATAPELQALAGRLRQRAAG